MTVASPVSVAALLPECRGPARSMCVADTGEIVEVPPMERMLHCGVQVRSDVYDFPEIGAGSLRFSFRQSDESLRAYLSWFDRLAYPRITLRVPAQVQNPHLGEAADGLWDVLPLEVSAADFLIEREILQPIDVVLQAGEFIGFDVGWQGGLALPFDEVQVGASAQMVQHLRTRGLAVPSLLRPWNHRFGSDQDIREQVEITLLNALPVPDTRMPLGEFLAFRREHEREFRLFRAAFDEIVAEVEQAGDLRLLAAKVTRIRDAATTLQEAVTKRVGRYGMVALRQSLSIVGGPAAAAMGYPSQVGEVAGAIAGTALEVRAEPQREALPVRLVDIRRYALELRRHRLLAS